MNKLLKQFTLLLSSTLFSQLGFTCSVTVIKNSSQVFLAKNFDWTYGEGYLIKNIRGVHKTAFPTTAGKTANWISKYGSITFNQNGKEMPYGGINEKGLAVEMLWLDYTNYYTSDTAACINELEWIQYQLDNFSSTADVVNHLNNLSIIPFKGKVHYMVADATGNSVIVEHLNGKISIEQKPANQCQAITNYDITTSANWYAIKENAAKGNVTNALYRYSALQTGLAMLNDESKLSYTTAFDLMSDVTIKKGEFKTYWTIVYDLKNRQVYFKTADAKNIKQVSLADIDFSAAILGIEINTKKNGDITRQLTDYSRGANTDMIKYSLSLLGLANLNFEEISGHQFDYSVTANNSYSNHYATLTINIKNADSTRLGKVGIVVFDNETDMKNLKPWKDGVHFISVNGTKYSWVYYGLPMGKYAIASMQDVNNNRRPDFESEKYAFSKLARVKDGNLPIFSDCSIMVNNRIVETTLVLE